MLGPYWKLKMFRAAHLGRTDEALHIATVIGDSFRDRCPFFYLDVLAGRAWLERRMHGRQSNQMEEELELFETAGVKGRKALLTAQGFLA
jgi:hypothetical protein